MQLVCAEYATRRALGHLSPVDALKSWRVKKPELFLKRVYKQAELDKREHTLDRSDHQRSQCLI